VQGRDQFRELIIQNAPCLERLLQLIPGLHTSVISSTPKLETLGFLSSSNRLQLHSTVIQVAVTFLLAFTALLTCISLC
jgi:hypothetical protein